MKFFKWLDLHQNAEKSHGGGNLSELGIADEARVNARRVDIDSLSLNEVMDETRRGSANAHVFSKQFSSGDK